jgi:threonine aldolase
MFIDLRSDTVTRPCKAMLDAMMTAEVGDDVFLEDPTVIKLEEYSAKLFGKEKALFCPSGTMTNQIAINLNTTPLGQVITHDLSHIYQYEGGGPAFNSQVSTRLIDGNKGQLIAQDIIKNINPDDIHCPMTQLVSIENTCNRAGGSIYDFNEIKKIRKICNENNLKLHLDGARLFNALVETQETAKDYGDVFDTISICLSKGLGAPIGSLIIGSAKDIKQARRLRKVFGGGMRQVGFLAAAGLFALQNNVERLKEDHLKAKAIGGQLSELNYVEKLYEVESNIVIFEMKTTHDPQNFYAHLETNGIKTVGFGGNIVRFVTHKDFTDEMMEPLEKALKSFNA